MATPYYPQETFYLVSKRQRRHRPGLTRRSDRRFPVVLTAECLTACCAQAPDVCSSSRGRGDAVPVEVVCVWGLLQQLAACLVSVDVCGAITSATATSTSPSAHGEARSAATIRRPSVFWTNVRSCLSLKLSEGPVVAPTRTFGYKPNGAGHAAKAPRSGAQCTPVCERNPGISCRKLLADAGSWTG